MILIPTFGLAQCTGHVGINTTTPSATLHVNGNLKLKASQGLPSDSILDLYHFQYSNITGQPVNINRFTVNFSGLICNY